MANRHPRVSLGVRVGQHMSVTNFHGVETLGKVSRVTPTGRFIVSGRAYAADGRAAGATRSSKSWARPLDGEALGRIEANEAVLALRTTLTRLSAAVHGPAYTPPVTADRARELRDVMDAIAKELMR